MACEALRLFENWQEFTGLRETRANFKRTGVLFLFPGDDANVQKVLEQQRRAGVVSELLDQQQLAEAFPDMDFCATLLDLDADEHHCTTGLQVLHEPEPGFAEPVGTAEDLLDAARALGATVTYKARVSEILHRGGRVHGVRAETPAGGETVHAPLVVNCAGPWAMGLNAAAGVTLPMRLVAIRAQMVSKHFPERLKGPLPMVSDLVNGFYFRLEASGSEIVVGSLREEEEREVVPDPDHYNERADAPYREEKLTILHHRIPTFQARGTVTSYSGLYTVNLEDYHPIVDETDLDGFYAVCGFSGHGFKLAPIVGTLLARKALGQWGRVESRVPLHYLDKDREPMPTFWGGVTA